MISEVNGKDVNLEGNQEEDVPDDNHGEVSIKGRGLVALEVKNILQEFREKTSNSNRAGNDAKDELGIVLKPQKFGLK